MRQASKRILDSAEKTVRDIRRATRRHHSAEEKIRIVLEGLRGEDSIAELCREEGINQNLYYRWSKEFLEAGKKRLTGDTAREATSDEVKELKAEGSAPLNKQFYKSEVGLKRRVRTDVHRVIALRMMRLGSSGSVAVTEAWPMISEKASAFEESEGHHEAAKALALAVTGVMVIMLIWNLVMVLLY